MFNDSNTLRGDPRVRLHANARLTPAARRLLVDRVRKESWAVKAAAQAAGVSRRTGHKWLQRFEEAGESGLANDAVQEGLLRRAPRVGVLRVLLNRVGCSARTGRRRALAGGSTLRHRARSDASRVPAPPVSTSPIEIDRAFAFTR